jgi:hypothetical protein
MEFIVIHQHAQEHYRACHRHGKTKDYPRRPTPPQPSRDQTTQHGGYSALTHGSGDGHTPHIQKLLDMKLKPDTEHEKNNADFRKLFSHDAIGNKAGSMRSDSNACQKITDNR